MNEEQKDQVLNSNAYESNRDSFELRSIMNNVKQVMPLAIWALLIVTWYSVSIQANSSLITETIPAIVIITICLVIRFLSQPRR